MHILIVGASQKTSIGFGIAEALTQHGCTYTLVNRSGSLGAHILDVSDHSAVEQFFLFHAFDAIVHTAGVFVHNTQDEESHYAARVDGYTHLVSVTKAPIFVIGGHLPEHRDVALDSIYAKTNAVLDRLICTNNTLGRNDRYIIIGNIRGSTMIKKFESISSGVLTYDTDINTCSNEIATQILEKKDRAMLCQSECICL